MKVHEIYDKNSAILDHGKNIFKTTETYLARFPEQYGECYRRNLETLELIKVDRLDDKSQVGIYNAEANIILFAKNFSLGHELFHMASNDTISKQYAFESKLCVENGLIEGMTEYHHMRAYDLKLPGAYSFEVFAVTMLEDIPNIFESYFIPKEKGIFSVCPNKKDMYALLCSLDLYNALTLEYLSELYSGDENPTIDKSEIRRTIKHVIDSLISIELSLHNDKRELNNYSDKFMDLLSSDFIADIVPYFYPSYISYADKQIKQRIKER